MKKPFYPILGIILLITVLLPGNPAKAQQSLIKVNGWNAYVHLPADYNSAANSAKSFPTIIFFPGLGEIGTTASLVIANGPGAYLTQGWDGNVQVGTDSVEFIIISLQPPAAYPQEVTINANIQTLKSLYRIDKKRLYLTGLSMGGWCSTTFITADAYGGPYNYASQVAAVVDVEGVKPDDNSPYPNLFDNFSLSGGRLLGFQQQNDDRDIPTIVGRMNATVPNSAIYIQTDYSGGGHCCWEQFYGGLGVQPGIFSLDGVNQNIYQWMARQGSSNIPPVAKAGSDQSISLPASSATLAGSGSDADGSIVSYSWSESVGPTQATITNATSATATASGLAQGIYNFVLTVMDNNGSLSHDTMQLVVNAAAGACNTNKPITYIQGATAPGDVYFPNGGVWKGGDTIKITAGFYSDVIEFDNIQGDPCHPITIINNGGVVSAPLMRFKNNCAYIHITGSGVAGTAYGFKTTNGPMAIDQANHIEIDHVEITNPVNGVGMMIKRIPDTTQKGSYYIKGATNNYLMNRFYIHDNWIHNTNGEGLYIGATDPDGGQHGNDSVGNPLLPIRMDSVEISNNLVEYTAWDGIQLSNAKDGAKIHDNIVRHYGLVNMGSQQAGIILGGNTSGSIYNNKVTQGTGNGIQVFGYGAISLYNNFLDSTGVDSTSTGQESYTSNDYITTSESNPKQQIVMYGNSFNHPQPRGAVRINADQNNSLISNVHDNTFCIPGALATWQSTYLILNVGGANVNNVLYCPAGAPVPTANAGSDAVITLPVSVISLSGSGSDVNGSIASYKWAQVSGPSTAIITSTILASTTATTLIQGVYKFSLTVTDTSGTTAKDTVQVTVNVANVPPVANAGINQAVTLPTNSVTLSGSGTDANGTIASYLWAKLSGPTAGTISSTTAATTTVTGLVQGIYQFTLTVTDNAGATGKDTIQVTVNAAANVSPVSNAGTDATITLPTNNVTLSGNGTDADGTIASYQWVKVSGPIAGTITSATSASTTVTALAQGVYKFSLIVTDNSGATSKDTMQVTVNAAPNVLPVSNAGTDATITLPTNSVTLSGNGTDADGTIASYQWAKVSGPTAGTIASATSSSTTVTALVQGVYKFSLTVTDNSGATSKDTMQVTVNAAPNVLPVSNAGTDATITLPTNSVTLSGNGTDADGTIASYQWAKVSGPTAGTIASATSASTTVTALVQGVYKFSLTVTDNNGATSKDTMQVTVNAAPNVLPVSNAGTDATITLPTNSVTLSGNGTDADGTIASYQWIKVSGPTAGTITSATSASTTVTALAQGVYEFSLTVTDNSGATGKDTMRVTVNAANILPVSRAGADQAIILPTNSITLSGGGTDADGTVASYQWIKISGPTAGTITNATSASTTVTALAQGVYKFSLTVTDNSGAINIDTVQITVDAPPSVNAGSDMIVNLPDGNLVLSITTNATLTGTATDADGTITSYQWSEVSGPVAATITSPVSASTTVTGLIQGVYQFALTAKDNNGAIGKDTILVTVNVPPVASAGTDQIITLPANSATLSGGGIDADGTVVSYQWVKVSGPAAGTITSATTSGTTVTGLTTGVYKFAVTVTDNRGATGKDTMQVTVNTANIPPVAHAGTDQLISLPVNSVTLSGSGTDADGTVASYKWSKLSGPTPGTITSSTVASTTVTALAAGVYKFILTVTDNSGATGVDTIQVTVNTPPVSNAGNDQTITLPAASVTLSGNGTDADGTISSYQWSKLSGPSSGTIISTGSSVTTVTALVQGTYKFVLTVTDNSGAAGKDTMQVVVNAAAITITNVPPTASAGADQLISLPVNTVTLNGSGTDADGIIASYQWSKLSGPASATITSTTSAVTTVTAMAAGIYKFVLTVTDNKGATGKDTIQVTVNIPPVSNAGNDQVITLPTNSVILAGTGTDGDGIIASYQWSKLSGPVAGAITNAAATGTTVTGLSAGVYKYVLTVTDNNGATEKDTIQITVNIPPVAKAGSDRVITLPINSITLSGSGTDADGTVAAYQWTKISGPASGTVNNASSASTTITGLTAGVYTYALKVTDTNGATASDTIQVIVNMPPVANAGSDQVITLPINSVTLAGSGTDTDGTIASYQWSKLSGPVSGTITNATSGSTTVTGLTAGIYKYALTVTDNNGTVARDTMQVIVNIAPVSNAGTDQLITLPTNSVTLSGSGTDADGIAASYQWSKLSGPAAGTITNAALPGTTITGLAAGIYKYVLAVTDNNGAITKDTIQVTVNLSPVANAGADQTITLPINGVALNGSANSDADGTITSYQWVKISGPAAGTITNTLSASTTVSSMVQGTYKFALTVTDNNGATGNDTIQVIVNTAPIANAGADKTIALPINSVSLTGSGIDVDGIVSAYKWAETSGPSTAAITSATSASTTITGMVAGVYKFLLTITDNNGGVGKDSVTVTVTGASNIPPVANAGADISITLPVNSASLTGNGTDADGTVASYQWIEISGPASGTIAKATSAKTTVSSLTAGIYKFVLTVTDNSGATANDTMQVTVKAGNVPPVANAGTDMTVALPSNSVVLSGSGTDVDGTITSYHWVKIAGPSKGSTGNASNASITVSNLGEGVYQYELTVTDNDGAKAKDTVQVTVTASTALQVFAGPNPVQSSVTAQVSNISSTSQTLAVTLTNTSGMIIYSSVVPANQSTQVMNIDMSKLRPGIYFLNVKSSDGKSNVTKTLFKR